MGLDSAVTQQVRPDELNMHALPYVLRWLVPQAGYLSLISRTA